MVFISSFWNADILRPPMVLFVPSSLAQSAANSNLKPQENGKGLQFSRNPTNSSEDWGLEIRANIRLSEGIEKMGVLRDTAAKALGVQSAGGQAHKEGREPGEHRFHLELVPTPSRDRESFFRHWTRQTSFSFFFLASKFAVYSKKMHMRFSTN